MHPLHTSAGVFASAPREGIASRAIVQEEADGAMNLLVAGDGEGNFHLRSVSPQWTGAF